MYVIMLSAVPCCAGDNCNNDFKTEQSDKHKETTDCNACSPFFSCGSCTGFTFQLSRYSLTPVVLLSQGNFPVFEQHFYSQFCLNIWQPPKLS